MTPLLLCTSALRAQDYSWPRQIAVSAGTIVLYQPQAEKLIGNELTARGAIALKVTGRADPIFGAMWMTATVDVDRDSGIVWLTNLKVTRVRWPDAKPEQQQRFTQFVESDFPTTGFRTTLARFQASLASAEAERTHTEGLKADAPKIVFVEQLAVLLLYDGEPRTKPIENTGLAVVINTPFGVIKDTASGTYWLDGDGCQGPVDSWGHAAGRHLEDGAGGHRVSASRHVDRAGRHLATPAPAGDRDRDGTDRAGGHARSTQVADDRRRQAALRGKHRDAMDPRNRGAV